MSLTFDESKITKSITYKCITKIQQYNTVATYHLMPVLTYCPQTCLITSVIPHNSYYLEYTILVNGIPIIPQKTVTNNENIWFHSIIPYNINTVPYNLELAFYSPVQRVLEVETTIINFDPTYFFTLLNSNSTFTDTFHNVSCTLNYGTLTLQPITQLEPNVIINATNLSLMNEKKLYSDLSLITDQLALFEFKDFKTIFVTEQDTFYVGSLVIDPKIDVIKSLFIQTISSDIANVAIKASFQDLPIVSTITKSTALITFNNNMFLNFNTYHNYQLTIYTHNTTPMQEFLNCIDSLYIYAEGHYVSNDIKNNNRSNIFITLN